MIQSIYKALSDDEKFLLLQTAANPIYQKLLQKHKEDLIRQKTALRKSSEISDSDYVRQHENLSVEISLIEGLDEINQNVLAKFKQT